MNKEEGQYCWPITWAAGVVAAIVLGLVAFLSKPGTDIDWASWVQAVGSIAAILVAVEVANRQVAAARAHANEQERRDTKSVLYAIRDEVEVLWEAFQQRVGNDLTASQRGTIFNYWWPSPESPFVIYKASAAVVGRISDHALRHAIVIAYARAEGVLVTFRAHNRLLKDREQESRLADENPESEIFRRRLTESTILLIQYDDQLRDLYVDLQNRIANLLRLLPQREADKPI